MDKRTYHVSKLNGVDHAKDIATGPCFAAELPMWGSSSRIATSYHNPCRFQRGWRSAQGIHTKEDVSRIACSGHRRRMHAFARLRLGTLLFEYVAAGSQPGIGECILTTIQPFPCDRLRKPHTVLRLLGTGHVWALILGL